MLLRSRCRFASVDLYTVRLYLKTRTTLFLFLSPHKREGKLLIGGKVVKIEIAKPTFFAGFLSMITARPQGPMQLTCKIIQEERTYLSPPRTAEVGSTNRHLATVR